MPLLWPLIYLTLSFSFSMVLHMFFIPGRYQKCKCTSPEHRNLIQMIIEAIHDHCLYFNAVSISIFNDELETTKDAKF